ncbi:MAG: hypothetical protein AB1791_21260, partial [Chloroflexota bacterium]
MDDENTFRRVAAVTAVLAAPPAIGSLVVGLAALGNDFDAFSDPSLLLAATTSAGLLRWSVLLNMFGYYLLLTPAALYLWHWLKTQSPHLVKLYSLCGLGYLWLGVMGAAILASVWPSLVNAYSQAAAGQQETITVVFEGITAVVEGGLWSNPQDLLGGLWWLGIGSFLRRERSGLGLLTMVLGAAVLLNSLGDFLNLETLDTIGLSLALLLVPIWSIWLGLTLLR